MVDFLDVLVSRGRGIMLVYVLLYAENVIISILGSVSEAAADAILVVRWGIGLFIVHRTSRSPSRFPYHHQF